jgi:hypothetical protein
LADRDFDAEIERLKSRRQETGNRKQETENRKQETENRKQKTGNRKQRWWAPDGANYCMEF